MKTFAQIEPSNGPLIGCRLESNHWMQIQEHLNSRNPLFILQQGLS